MKEKMKAIFKVVFDVASALVLIFAVLALFMDRYAESAALFGLYIAGRIEK